MDEPGDSSSDPSTRPLVRPRRGFPRRLLADRRIDPGAVTVVSKWGYTYTAGWTSRRASRGEGPLARHAPASDRREPARPRRASDLYQIHSATPRAASLRPGSAGRASRIRAGGGRIGLTLSGPRQAEVGRRRSRSRSTAQPLRYRAGDLERARTLGRRSDAKRARGGQVVIVKEALANGILTARRRRHSPGEKGSSPRRAARERGTTIDAIALAAALARRGFDVVLSGAASASSCARTTPLDLAWDDESKPRWPLSPSRATTTGGATQPRLECARSGCPCRPTPCFDWLSTSGSRLDSQRSSTASPEHSKGAWFADGLLVPGARPRVVGTRPPEPRRRQSLRGRKAPPSSVTEESGQHRYQIDETTVRLTLPGVPRTEELSPSTRRAPPSPRPPRSPSAWRRRVAPAVLACHREHRDRAGGVDERRSRPTPVNAGGDATDARLNDAPTSRRGDGEQISLIERLGEADEVGEVPW